MNSLRYLSHKTYLSDCFKALLKPRKNILFVFGTLFALVASFYTLPAFSAVEINYSYDDLNRLETVTRADGPVVQYGYDEAGGLAQQTVSNSPDTDGDLVANFVDSDDDNDGLPDSYELQYDLNPLDPADASDDPDGDGKTNLQEFQNGTDPLVHNGSTQVPTLPEWAFILLMLILSYLLRYFSRQRQGV